MDKIFNGLDYARRDKCNSVIERIRKLAKKGKIKFVEAEDSKAKPVHAEINAGRWIAQCPDCAGAEAVSAEEPIFFCFSCGNERIGGKLRRVQFPEHFKEIEAELLKRPVRLMAGRDEIAKMLDAIPERLPRAWTPDETIEDLQEQNREAGL